MYRLFIILIFFSENHKEHAHSAVHSHNPNKVADKKRETPEAEDTNKKPTAKGIC